MSFAVAFLLVLFISVILFALGLRGRRVDDHPLCGRCRFDLSRQPATSDRCPECGADIRLAKAVVIGHRARNRRLLASGAVLLLLIVVPMIVVGIAVLRGASWRAYTPTWFELAEARNAFRGDVGAAIDELIARDTAAKLQADQQRQLADAIVQCQVNVAVPWKSTWSSWIGSKIVDGSLATGARDRYLTNLVNALQFSVRPRVRQGDEIALNWSKKAMRGLLPYQTPFVIEMDPIKDRQFFIDGTLVPVGEHEHPYWNQIDLTQASLGQTDSKSVYDATLLMPGQHVLEWRDQMRVMSANSPTASELLVLPSDRRATIVVEPRDSPGVTLVDNESLRAKVQSALANLSIQLGSGNNSSMFFLRYAQPLPIDIAFDVVLKQDGEEIPLLKITRRTSDDPTHYGYGFSVFGSHRPKLGMGELILRPSPDAARATVDITEIFGGELHVPDVPVK